MKKSIFLALSILLIACSVWATETVVIGGGGVSEGSDVGFGNITATSLKVDQGSAANPSVSLGDGDTGLYESSDDTLDITLNGIKKYTFNGNYMLTETTTGSAAMLSSAGTATNTTFGFYGDPDTGVTRTGIDQLSLSAGGEVLRLDASVTSGDTRFLIYDVDNGTLERVTVGAADTGGAGYKVLRIPN